MSNNETHITAKLLERIATLEEDMLQIDESDEDGFLLTRMQNELAELRRLLSKQTYLITASPMLRDTEFKNLMLNNNNCIQFHHVPTDVTCTSRHIASMDAAELVAVISIMEAELEVFLAENCKGEAGRTIDYWIEKQVEALTDLRRQQLRSKFFCGKAASHMHTF